MGKHNKKVMNTVDMENAQDVKFEAVPETPEASEGETEKVSFLGKGLGKVKNFAVGVGHGVKKHGKKIVAGVAIVGGAIATGVILTALHGKDAESVIESELDQENEDIPDYPQDDYEEEETTEDEPDYDFAVKVVNWPEKSEDSNEADETKEVEEV